MTEDKEREITEVLASKGIIMNVGACGCCGSPWVYLEIDGQVLLDNEDGAGFEMKEIK